MNMLEPTLSFGLWDPNSSMPFDPDKHTAQQVGYGILNPFPTLFPYIDQDNETFIRGELASHVRLWEDHTKLYSLMKAGAFEKLTLREITSYSDNVALSFANPHVYVTIYPEKGDRLITFNGIKTAYPHAPVTSFDMVDDGMFKITVADHPNYIAVHCAGRMVLSASRGDIETISALMPAS